MSENGSNGPRSEYLARIRRFADEMLDRLNEASRRKDVDDKEIRSLRNFVLKALRIWDKALLEGQHYPRLEGNAPAGRETDLPSQETDWRDIVSVGGV